MVGFGETLLGYFAGGICRSINHRFDANHWVSFENQSEAAPRTAEQILQTRFECKQIINERFV